MNNCWNKIWPDCGKYLDKNTKVECENEQGKIIQLSKRIGGDGFEDLDADDIEDALLDDELNEDELLAMIGYDCDCDHVSDESDSNEEETVKLHTKTLTEITDQAIRPG